MNQNWTWPGSRWWKCDFHLHTTASDDFMDPGTSAEQWVKAAVAAGLDVVAVTDHNSCGGISSIQQAANGTGLTVLPGIELAVQPGVHVLALFDPGSDAQAPASFHGVCGLAASDVGKSDAVATASVEDALANATARSGLAIAAHVDGPKGILREMSRNNALRAVLKNKHLSAVEVNVGTDASLMQLIDGSVPGYERDTGLLPVVTCSDAHRLSEIGRRSTWIKMTAPTLEGLRLALQDGQDSVVHCRDTARFANPNAHADVIVESIEIRDARYIGRMAAFGPLVVPFNPWLNTVIGGRGTGKSTIVEFLRKVMRREHELPKPLRDSFDEIMVAASKRNDRGLLLSDTIIRVVYRKGDDRYRVQWNQSGDLQAIERIEADGSSTAVDGKVIDHFPIRIFSQKQVFELATTPASLLQIIDDAKAVDGRGWRNRFDAEVNQFLALRSQARSLAAALEEAPRTHIALADIKRKLTVFENTHYAEVLKTYERRKRQQTALADMSQSMTNGLTEAEAALSLITPTSIDESLFLDEDPADAALATSLRSMLEDFVAIQGNISALLQQAQARSTQWQNDLAASAWTAGLEQATTAYDALVLQLQAEQIAAPDEYGRLLQERQLLETKLQGFEARRIELAGLERQATETLSRILVLRREISQRRQEFLNSLNANNDLVRVEVATYGFLDQVESDVRPLLGLNDGTFERVLGTPGNSDGTLLGDLYPEILDDEALTRPVEVSDFESRLEVFKAKILAMHRQEDQTVDQRFAKALQKVPIESLDRLLCWFPEDTLLVSYRPVGQNGGMRPITQGSPGQKTAAMLAFLLSYGEEPIVLDQPEDDLDNQLIYDLIVRQLREVKKRRQVIVVTHNANIVVNGDAELVVALDSQKGQTVVERGGLQEAAVRARICAIMEGGKQAFEQRYRRIALGS